MEEVSIGFMRGADLRRRFLGHATRNRAHVPRRAVAHAGPGRTRTSRATCTARVALLSFAGSPITSLTRITCCEGVSSRRIEPRGVMAEYCEREGVVSIWVGAFSSEGQLRAYLHEQYEDDGAPLSEFARDCGLCWYDHDSVESRFADEVGLADLLQPFSY